MHADELQLAIDRDAEVPIGVQLAWALRARIEDGSARTGERLPGLREVAQATGLNINTVRAVYQRLDQEGLIESRQGSGTFVSGATRTPTHARTIATNAAREARESGIDPRQVAAALYVSGDRADTPSYEPREESQAEARARLRREITVLERAVGEIEAEYPGIAPLPGRARRQAGPRLLDTAELAAVRTALIQRLAVVQVAIEEHLAGPSLDTGPRAKASAAEIVTGPKQVARAAKASARAPKRASRKTKSPPARRTTRPAIAET